MRPGVDQLAPSGPSMIKRTPVDPKKPSLASLWSSRSTRRLEQTSQPVDAISYAVGYEDPASFRRLFKRITGVPPGVYRRKLQLPAFARTASDRA